MMDDVGYGESVQEVRGGAEGAIWRDGGGEHEKMS